MIHQLDADSVRASLDTSTAFWEDSGGFGFLTLSSSPTNAETYVDGNFKGYTSTQLGLSVGHHTYEIKASGTLVPLDCHGNLDVLKDRSYSKSCP